MAGRCGAKGCHLGGSAAPFPAGGTPSAPSPRIDAAGLGPPGWSQGWGRPVRSLPLAWWPQRVVGRLTTPGARDYPGARGAGRRAAALEGATSGASAPAPCPVAPLRPALSTAAPPPHALSTARAVVRTPVSHRRARVSNNQDQHGGRDGTHGNRGHPGGLHGRAQAHGRNAALHCASASQRHAAQDYARAVLGAAAHPAPALRSILAAQAPPGLHRDHRRSALARPGGDPAPPRRGAPGASRTRGIAALS